jgi:hypothetical protein
MMTVNNSISVYKRNFPGYEEVKRTEKYMNKTCVVPKSSINIIAVSGATIPSVF